MSELRKDLRASTAEGAATSVMVGIGETYLPAFVLALSGSQLACGLVATVPLLAGAVLQLVSPWMVRRLGSHRRWVVFSAAAQGLAFLPLAAAALVGAMPLVLVFAFAALYWAGGMAGGPAWNAWMDTLVPGRLRARYFAERTRASQWGLAIGFAAGGMLLHATSAGHWSLAAFALLFAIALVGRVASVHLLCRQREPFPPHGHVVLPPLGQMLRALLRSGNGAILAYLLAAQTAVQIASPYFNPYLLGHMAMPYADYVILICTAWIAKTLFLPRLGRMVDRWGAERVFWLGSIGIIPLPALWLVSNWFPYLIAVQVLSGAAWGAYELASLMLFFETIPRAKRVGVLTLFNLANAAAIVLGSLLGGALLAVLGSSGPAYLTLFAVSSAARAMALVLLVRMPRTSLARPAAAMQPIVHATLPLVPAPAILPLPENYPPAPHWSQKAAPRYK